MLMHRMGWFEHFLIPEASPRTFQITDAEAQQNVCFNFVAGNDENAVYGAVWRLPFVHSNGITTQGVCVLSKYPLVDSMRHFLRVFVETKARLDREKNPKEEASTSTSGEVVEGELNTLTLREAQQAFDLYFKTRHIPPRPITQAIDNLEDGHLDLPSVDISLQDLFDCLSITHILRLVALALLEKKIVLVSSSYSVLLTVGESLKSLLYPLTWSHIYVPVLPLALKGYLHCPTPFIFGLHNSYVRNSELPRAADDLVIVNLDRDSLTGGGDVSWPPTRNAAMRDRLVKICKPRLQFRDNIEFDYANGNESRINEAFPTEAIRRVLYDELQDMLSTLEAFAFRFAFHDKFVTVVDSSNKSRMWASDTSRFYAMLLQTQAFSAHLSSLQNL
uniref:UDENN domain-containing protein n=1 Tax=Globisporangium ultimum (strain ATCC 200006 / CBS 805.95 / DAOM BR144) TaxID=431595 RepID=K3WD93_GLOUD